jgi:hypothetical protein
MSRGGKRGVPPDLKGTLGTLIRTTINQVGAMTDVARRQARSQKQRLDTALLERRRREALTELGENLYELASRGDIELDELPELFQGVQAVEEIDREIAEAAAETQKRNPRRPVRLERARPAEHPGDRRERVWRPPVEADDVQPEAQEGSPEEARAALGRSSRESVRRAASTASRGGGIVFVDEDDTESDDSLASYMNDDDVPRRR